MRARTIVGFFLLALAGTSGASLSAQLGWRAHEDLSDRTGFATAFDPIRRRSVIFGGGRVVFDWWTELGETWEWDGRRWTFMRPKTSPSIRDASSMAWDPISRRVILFGGGSQPTAKVYSDTWAWDGSDWTLLKPTTIPPQRLGHRMVTDLSRGRLVMFGGYARMPSGFTNAMPLNDTWEWTGTNWVQVKTRSAPSPRGGFGYSYDAIARRVLLTGGTDGLRYSPTGTWSYDGKDWKKLSPRIEPPKSGAQMSTDYRSGRVYWYDERQFPVDQFYAWSGAEWTRLSIPSMPPTRQTPRLMTDPLTGRVTLCGGFARDQTNARDLWLFDGAVWKRVEGRTLPQFGVYFVATYDSDEDRLLFVGSPNGVDPQKPSRVETWSYRDGRFTRIFTKNAPPERSKASLVYHAATKSFLLVGGLGYTIPPTGVSSRPLDETWIFDGKDWREHTAGPRPAASQAPPMAYDSARKKIVLHYGGPGVGAPTWEWDGKAWKLHNVPGVPRYLGTMGIAYDPLRRRTIAYDPRKTPPSTYEYDGKSWKKTSPIANPSPPRNNGLIVPAPFLGGVMLCGGWSYDAKREITPRADSWLYDGKTWRKLAAIPPPSPTRMHWPAQAVSDAGRLRVLMIYYFGPRYYIASPIWELSHRSLTTSLHHPRPGQSFTLSANLPTQGNVPLLFALSTRGLPGILLDALPRGRGLRLPLGADWLLDLSLRAGAITLLDSQGKGTLTVPVPPVVELTGFDFLAAGLTLNQGGVGAITNPLPFQIGK